MAARDAHVSADGVNSTDTPLVVAGTNTFVGVYEDVSGWASASVVSYADVDGANPSLTVYQSNDAATDMISFTAPDQAFAGAGFRYEVPIVARYLRVEYDNNGSVDQTSFDLKTMYHRYRTGITQLAANDGGNATVAIAGTVSTTTGGGTPFSSTDLGNSGLSVVGVGATLTSITVTNQNASLTRYLHIYDHADAPVAGDSADVKATIPLFAQTTQNLVLNMSMSNGIGFRATTVLPSTDTNDPATNDVVLSGAWKSP